MNSQSADLMDEEPIELGVLAESLGFMLRIAQVHCFEMFFDRLGPQGLKPGEFTMLWVVRLNPDIRQGTLARWLRIKPAHMTKLVQKMVSAGHLQRRVPEDDRRSVHLSLTDEGETYVAKHRDEFLTFHEAERSMLNEEECAELARLLGKMTGFRREAL
ncbi:MarR family winged helix-turn-helix transcriptional regulator [Pseudoruegeria sp. HB172150]|uniref:MarR family winged helix-turn-helix transcriptional regulator n=1 Tax=Pseudoruegeria sp. HB172150 TaxID=2721164 RepID=UPI0015542AC6|nr:MarR family transcriptional regulator [Pseudoruegeria sp. HB172150]